MNEDEMIKDMENIVAGALAEWVLRKMYNTNQSVLIAKRVIEAGYRKVGEDEIVESMKTYERARQETAKEILQRFYNRAKSNKNDFADVNSYEIELMAEEFGIELE